jgi:dynein assembly factor with WDR repeat domains 1
VDAVVDEIARKEPLITPNKTEQIRKLIIRLQEKQLQPDDHDFHLFKVRLSEQGSKDLRLLCDHL